LRHAACSTCEPLEPLAGDHDSDFIFAVEGHGDVLRDHAQGTALRKEKGPIWQAERKVHNKGAVG
jgi:hypothetical protein